METNCPTCGRAYGKRKRCYVCKPAKQRTGEIHTCQNCGKEFYVQLNVAQDTARNSGTFCSRACFLAGRAVRQADPDQRVLHSAGYVLAFAPDHPRARSGRVFEHILVMEAKLGRYLADGEFVHHRDENKQNNDPGNLVLVTNPEHARIHGIGGWNKDPVAVTCAECGKSFDTKRSRAISTDPRSQSKYCSLECRHKAWSRQMVAKRAAKRAARPAE